MNRKRYTSDPRYSAVLDNMDLLGITDVSTKRQEKNGTIQWRLPIKNIWPGNRKNATYIEVASFESGYVRRQNGCYTPYQLNKCEGVDHYYKAYEWIGEKQRFTGKYNKFVGKKRILIEDKRDRLEYLIDYCLKNYYIKQANQVEDGKFIPKWKHEYEMKNGSLDRVRELQIENRELKKEMDDRGALDNLSVIVNNERYKII